MVYDIALNAFNTILVFGVGFPSIYMASKIKVPSLRNTSILLSAFLIMHGLYHLTELVSNFAGFEWAGALSDAVVEPLGWLLLLVFFVYFARRLS